MTASSASSGSSLLDGLTRWLRRPGTDGIVLTLSQDEQEALRAILAEMRAEEPPPPPPKPPLWPRFLGAGLALLVPVAGILALPDARQAILEALARAAALFNQ